MLIDSTIPINAVNDFFVPACVTINKCYLIPKRGGGWGRGEGGGGRGEEGPVFVGVLSKGGGLGSVFETLLPL